MVSIKIKFRPSTIDGKEGIIYYQVIKNRVVRQLKTEYRIFNSEWDEKGKKLLFINPIRYDYLRSIEERIKLDLKCLDNLISKYNTTSTDFSSDDLINGFQNQFNEQSFFNFMQKQIIQLKQMGKYRTSETYHATLNSFTTLALNIFFGAVFIYSRSKYRTENFYSARGFVRNANRQISETAL